MIHIGFVHIRLDRPQVIQKEAHISLFRSCTEESYKLDLIERLLHVIQVDIQSVGPVDILCSIQVGTQLGSDSALFLELLCLTSTDPKQFKPVLPTYSTRLIDVFLQLNSPKIDWHPQPDILKYLANKVEAPIPSMKTTLYSYQKHSVWKILQRELVPMSIHPYTVVPLKDRYDSVYYLNQLTGEISRSVDTVHDAQGGIICEDMGTGKTCICLATVMISRDFSSAVEHPHTKTDLERPFVQTLKAISASWVLKYGINWKPVKHQLPLDVTEWFQRYPLYYEWTDVPYLFERPRRIQPMLNTLVIYLSNATLVVVPDNLVAQWTGEIYKHIKDGQLNFIVYDDTKQKIAPPRQLLDYDLVLISQTRFSFENSQGGLDFTSYPCQCPLIGQESACICSMTRTQSYISPLLQVHWKRFIVDEGHKLSSKNRQSELASKLFSNWKWICTGTPTQNLTESAASHTRRESEMDDLNRLGILCGQVLQIEPFKSDKKAWQTWISKPFLERKPWAITRLTHMLERIMIRNQRKDIEKEVALPPLYQKTVYLDFDYYQWLAHNCQIAMIRLNAILSKREGPDYLFAPKNFKSLGETVHNLWQSCLWHSINPALLRSSYDNCVEKLHQVRLGTEDYGDENQDLIQIEQVLAHALQTNMFVCMMSQHSPSYIVQGLPNLFKETWGWLKGDHGAYIPLGQDWHDYCIMGAQQLYDAMTTVWHTKDATQHLFVYHGSDKTLLPVQDDNKTNDDQLTFYTRNAFSDTRVLSSSSVKLNYLLDQISHYQSTEKCVVFSQHANEMYEIYFALQLARIRVLLYQDSRMNNTQRSHMILTFNTSDNANVMIMAVQKAAYGIDLSTATRVYFVSPVWQPAMEQQAIKRAHRIGQTKPVYVETLVIRNTIEDQLLKRRNQVVQGQGLANDKENLKRGDFFADSKLRHILNHAAFVPLPPLVSQDKQTGLYSQPIQSLKTPLWFVPPHKKEPSPIVEQKTEDVLLDIEGDQDTTDSIPSYKARQASNKKRKTVQFAS